MTPQEKLDIFKQSVSNTSMINPTEMYMANSIYGKNSNYQGNQQQDLQQTPQQMFANDPSYQLPTAGVTMMTPGMLPQMGTSGIDMQKKAIEEGANAQEGIIRNQTPAYQGITDTQKQYSEDLGREQFAGEQKVQKDIENQQRYQQQMQQFRIISKKDILDNMSGTDKALSFLGSVLGGISQGMLHLNYNPYWQQANAIMDSQIEQNRAQYQQLAQGLQNAQNLTQQDRDMLSMRLNNLATLTNAKINAFQVKLTEVANDPNFKSALVQSQAKDRMGQLQQMKEQINFQNNQVQMQYGMMYGPYSQMYVPLLKGLAKDPESAKKINELAGNYQKSLDYLREIEYGVRTQGRNYLPGQYASQSKNLFAGLAEAASKVTGIPAESFKKDIGNPAFYWVQDQQAPINYVKNLLKNSFDQQVKNLNNGIPLRPTAIFPQAQMQQMAQPPPPQAPSQNKMNEQQLNQILGGNSKTIQEFIKQGP